MLGGGFMGQAHQTNKQNREMLKKHKKDQKQFLSGAENVDSVDRKNVQSSLTLEQQTLIKRELEAKKRREKTLSYIIPIAAIALAALLVYFLMY